LSEAAKASDASPTSLGQIERAGGETKRKYRRHPKPDKNAPDRPPSAYVIFSNNIREEVRCQNLSFTEIAKLVGDRWQKLSSDEKDPFESKASEAKEKFNVQLAQYKKTDSYKSYVQYISDFKAKHSSTTTDLKRLKLELDSSSGSGSGSNRSNDITVQTRPHASATHTRDISVGSVSSASRHGSFSSPKISTSGPPPTISGYSVHTHLPRISSSATEDSSTVTNHHHHRPQTAANLATRKPVNEEAHPLRSDLPELHSRAGRLSLAPASTTTIGTTCDLASISRTPAAFPPPLLHHQSSVSSAAYSDSSGTSIPFPATPADEPWRYHSTDDKARVSGWSRTQYPPLTNNYSTSFSQLPPMQASDRLPDVSRDPGKRTLPYPAPPSPRSFRGHPHNSTPLLASESSAGSPSEPRDETMSPLEPSEQDAANALAVLATTRR
jgi:HMG (high mobility group) box